MNIADALAWLFVPGDRPELFSKAAASNAHVVIIDLQDAVAHAAKSRARRHAREWIEAGGAACIRINPLTTADGLADLATLADLSARSDEWTRAHSPQLAIMIPLAEEVGAVDQVSGALPGTPIVPLIETARGVTRLRELCSHPATSRIAFGNLDMSTDLGCATSSPVVAAARAALVVESRAAELPPPVDGVTPDLENAAVFDKDAEAARTDGFGGKLCIHPAQARALTLVFQPSTEEVEWANRVQDAMHDGRGGVTTLDGAMVDAPVLRKARHILARAESSRSKVKA